ncbi:MAG: hypothetical protein J6D26_03710 [Clostridia bacterium]|nr:hypothetical protein [Clostridia bacterium]
MILTTAMLKEKLKNYQDPAGKISRMCKEGEIFKLTRGVYETDRNTPGYCLAPVIYGPSYLSFDYALSRYGLIPEAVYTFTSATCDKKKKKNYENTFGIFSYQDVPLRAYPFGIQVLTEGDYVYRIATPEKAICDKIYTISPVGSVKALEELLFEDLRIDSSEFDNLNKGDLIRLCDLYNTSNHKLLKKKLEGSRRG